MSDDEYIGDQELDRVARDMASHIIRDGNTSAVEEFLFATGERSSLNNSGDKPGRKRTVYIKCDKKIRARPARTKEENYALTAYVKIGGQEAFTLFDSGCTTEAISPDFARVAGIKVHPIVTPITLQLGTAGSRSKINHGTIATTKYDGLMSDEYMDIVNLDRYDAIVGTKYMRKHGIQLDFEYNCIRIRGKAAPTLTAVEESSEIERRNAARRIDKEE